MLVIKRLGMLVIVGIILISLVGCQKGDVDNQSATDKTTNESKVSAGVKEAESINLIFSNVTSDSAKDAGLRFKEIVEAESNGTVIVDLFPDNQLGDDRVVVETTQFGDIDIAVSSTSPLATMYADFYLFDAPYLFLSSEDAYNALDGPCLLYTSDAADEVSPV